MKKSQGSIDYRNKHFNKAKEQNNLDNQSNSLRFTQFKES
jgi:hypothetical protein